jgi:hypothetical protein
VSQEEINALKEKMFALNQAGKIREAGALRKKIKALEALPRAAPKVQPPPLTSDVVDATVAGGGGAATENIGGVTATDVVPAAAAIGSVETEEVLQPTTVGSLSVTALPASSGRDEKEIMVAGLRSKHKELSEKARELLKSGDKANATAVYRQVGVCLQRA